MKSLPARAAVGAIALLAALAVAPRPVEGARVWRGVAADSALVVPFVPQDELLCGGAAAAMVLRYHGARGVGAEAFAHLVRRDEGGIRTDELAASLAERGWRADEGVGDLDALAAALAAGLPPIVLIEVARGRWHYVVVVALENGAVRVHDPARAPDLRIEQSDFLARWDGGRRWMLLIHPRADAPIAETALGTGDGSPDLVSASAHFRAREWLAAAAAAERAVRAAPADARAWRLLGTARYLSDQPDAALDAWARVGDARVDGTVVRGLTRTRQPVAHALLGFVPGSALDADALALARRRLALLPTAALARVGYRALPDGWVEVEASVIESPPHPLTPAGLALVAGAAAGGEARAWLSGALGAGERLDLRWRPEAGGNTVALELAVPGALGHRGRTEVGVARAELDASRRASAWLRTTEWASPWLRWEVGARVDRLADGLRPAGTGALELASVDDRAVVRAAVALWPSRAADRSYVVLALDGALARGGATDAWTGRARGGMRALRGAGPAELRPVVDGSGAPALAGAFMGPDPSPLLRAHDAMRGSTVLHAGLEATRWAGGLVRVGVAAFVDGAVIAGGGERDALADAGAGLRLALPGLPTALRLDHAWSWSDGARRWSAGLSYAPGGWLRP